MAVAIQVESLGKRYRIGQRMQYHTLRDRLTYALEAPVRLLRGGSKDGSRAKHAEIWALRDISLSVQEGEVVGLLGRNGAGKTTLLKILSRVTQPTAGWADVVGRVGSLLEVGTGFHPELTGRENVFLNGAILGMGRREIARKFDEIVAFGEVADFIDTPIKHYSTGMQMRLAFAVAAHFEPEILLVDEVLAVGDSAFQKKCLGKMDQVARTGRTILFVSHQMSQIRRLCQRCIWIDRSRVRMDGPAGEVVSAYEAAQMDASDDKTGHSFLSWEIAGAKQTLCDGFREVDFRIQLRMAQPISQGHLGVAILNESNFTVVGWGFDGIHLPMGPQEISLKIPMLPLRPGVYTLVCSLFDRGNNLTGGQLVDNWYANPPLVVDTKPEGHPQDRWAGVLNVPAKFQVSEVRAVTQTVSIEVRECS